MLRIIRSLIFFSLFLCAITGWTQETEPSTLPQLPEVQIHSHNAQGALLRKGLGFIWDDHTVVTSYSAVQGASVIKLQIGGESVVAGELVSWSKPFDLAFLRTAQELPAGRLLGSSDTLASGDTAYLFAQDDGTWKLRETKLNQWQDSGLGYVWLYLSDPGTNAASPLFNRSGKIVGWFPGKSPAIPLKAVFAQLGEKSTPVSLQEVTVAEKFWNLLRVPSHQDQKKQFEQTTYKQITGPSGFPFQLSIPESWEHQTSQHLGHFLLVAVSGQSGVSLALRIASAVSGDLNMEIDRAENLLFPGIARNEMIPAFTGGISGMRAEYEDAQGFTSSAFYGLSSNRICVLSITYPSASTEEITPILEEVYNSLHFGN
jgi:hypothetical protein